MVSFFVFRGDIVGITTSYTILIVDDNENNLFSLKSLIEEYIDARVIKADCGPKALQELSKNDIDLIILDIQMEDMDGFEIASLIKQRKKTRDIPIVFLTASFTNEEFRQRGFEIGAADYLTKPIDEYQLINRINVYLRIIEKERNLNLELEQKVREQTMELRIAKEAAEAANEAKSMFLANISHELRTPLNIIMSINQMLRLYLNKNELDKGQVEKKVNMQVQNCYRLLRLVNNLIDITKMDSGHFELIKRKGNIVQIVECITMSVVEYIEDKGIGLVFDTDVEESTLYFDPDAIERIVLNLLSNAIKYTPSGGCIFVNIQSIEDGVVISIKDTGAGIDQEKIDVIFERFKQVDELLTRRHEGSGIGLSLVKSLIQMHGGSIEVHSEEQKGTEFIVMLPAGNEDESAKHYISSVYDDKQRLVEKINIEFSDIYF
ncbi:MAG: hybrid sensor histidine kinase/response regulator [Clostridia bacterium]|jgi:signal transduction histidine kinase|nr:hybrid sensor histidine kinase/response regulator [Clostridia bacterium]